MTLTVEQLDLLPDEALRPLLKVRLAQLAALRQQVTDLEAENLRLKQQLAGSSNSRNSS